MTRDSRWSRPERYGAAGGGGAVPWKQLTVDPGAIVDTGSLTTAGTGYATGRMTIVYAAHVLIVDGYQEAIATWSYPLLTLIPGFDPDRDTLEVWIDCPAWTHQATVAAGVFIGIADSTTIATRKAIMVQLRTSTIATDLIGLTDPASNPITSSPGLVDGVTCSFFGGSDGTNYPYAAVAQALIEGTTRVQQAAAGQDADNVLLAPVSNWQLTWGAWHGSTSSPAGVTQVVDLWYRVV